MFILRSKIKERYGKLADNLDVVIAPKRKEPQRPFRLMKILLSDRYAEGFSQLGNVADWVEYDTRKVSKNPTFWKGVQEAFEGEDKAYNNMHFADDEAFSDLYHINFGKVVPHSCKYYKLLY